VVRGLNGAKVGVLGARPAAFITVRYSEKLLEKAGISVESLDLSEAFGRAEGLAENDPEVSQKLDEIKAYVPTESVPDEALVKMAKFGLVMGRWIEENRLAATAVQCWTSMEEYFGIVPCTVMSMLSNTLMPSACETDITGAIGMYAMALASGQPSALVDWNNNYGDDPDKGIIFHCSNLPKDVFAEVKMDFQEIISLSVGKENTYGTVVGRIKTGPFTYCRVATDDERGTIRAYLGEGELVHLLSSSHRRRAWHHPRLPGRRRVDRRSGADLWRLRRGAHPRISGLAASHLRTRLRASRGHESVAGGARRE
jgi:L-fucose isomerase-like protein